LLHVARGICRRAERRLVSLVHTPGSSVSPQIVRYLNRLGDYLFVAARYANSHSGGSETAWQKPQP